MKISLITLSLVLAFGCARSESSTIGVAEVTPPTTGMETSVEPVAEEAPAEPVCTSAGMLSYVASADAYADRAGLHATHFSELTTSQQAPLEECSLDAILGRLVTLQCDDGTNPFQGNPNAAHASRAGSTGSGGRCGAILDVYEVPCAEGTYSVFADMYFCPAGRSAM